MAMEIFNTISPNYGGTKIIVTKIILLEHLDIYSDIMRLHAQKFPSVYGTVHVNVHVYAVPS